MIFTKTEIKVLELFVSRILDSFTIREISRITGKDLKIVHTSIQRLIAANFLIKEKGGLRLNYKQNIQDLAYIESLRKLQFFRKHNLIKAHVQNFLKKDTKKFFILLVFGSYASGKEDKKSDIDLLAVLPSLDESFSRNLKAALSMSSQEFHTEFVDADSFREMMQKREEMNVVNETFNNHIILYGSEQYYSFLGERDVR